MAKQSQTIDQMFKRMAPGSPTSKHGEESHPRAERPTLPRHLPMYPDIANLGPSGDVDDTTRSDMLTRQWDDAHLFDFPTRIIGGKKRKISPAWFKDHAWLRYSVSADSLYCGYCVLFGKKDAKEKLFMNPVSDWKNLGSYIKRHESNVSQHHGCVIAGENFLKVTQQKQQSVVSLLSSSHANQVSDNRHILQRIIEVIMLCGKQNIPIRGHTDDRSNFHAILQSFAQTDNILSKHLSSGDRRAKYTSPDVQNELIELCSNYIRDEIVRDCLKSSYFGIIADEATDKSTKEQLSICIRFLDETGDDTRVREEFIGLVKADSVRGEVIAQLIVTELEQCGLDITRLRAQCYDGAGNMSGKHKGVQARIRQVAPLANYVHCKAHSLNLALVHSSKDISVRTMMSTVQDIAFAFDYSAKRLTAFCAELAGDQKSKEQMDRRTKLRTLCETRWSSRADALYTFKTCYPAVVHALEGLQDGGDDKAGQHLAAILRFEFVIALVAAEHILSGTVALTNHLQAIDCDLIQAITESKTVIARLRDEREDPNVWDTLFNTAVEMAREFEIESAIPRRAGRQKHRANHPVDNPSDYWRVSLYLPFLDHLLQEMDQRLLQNEARFTAEYLLPAKLNGLTTEMVETIYDAYHDDLPQGKDAFLEEISRWKVRWRDAVGKPRRIIDALPDSNLYPNVRTIFVVLLTMPPSSASAERSFSAMRRVKNYLRSTMADDRLSGLAMLHSHRDMDVDISAIITKFAAGKHRRLEFV